MNTPPINPESMNLYVPIVNDFGGAPVAEHDVVCPVCLESHAVLLLNEGRFLPCWKCQSDGWRTYKFPRWLVRITDFFYR